MTSLDFLLGDAKSYQELAVQARVSGTTSHGLRMFKTTGVSTNADPKPGVALGWRSAYLRSQQPDG